MKYILVLLLTLHSLVFAKAFDLIVTPSHEEEPIKKEQKVDKPLSGKKMLIMVSSGELEKAGMGFTLGLSAASKGIDTTIVIGAKALASAKLEGIQNKFIAKDMTHREILQKAIKAGADVQICAMCAKALGLGNDDFIKGAHLVKSLKIFEKMYEDGVKVLSF
jgi:predicted peroxiredoxin